MRRTLWIIGSPTCFLRHVDHGIDHGPTSFTVHMLDRDTLTRCIGASFCKGHECTWESASAVGRMPHAARSLGSHRRDIEVGGADTVPALPCLLFNFLPPWWHHDRAKMIHDTRVDCSARSRRGMGKVQGTECNNVGVDTSRRSRTQTRQCLTVMF